MARPKPPRRGPRTDIVRMKIAEFQIRNERDLKACGRRVRLFAGLADLTRPQRANLGKAFTEAAVALLQHNAHQRVDFAFVSKDGRHVSILPHDMSSDLALKAIRSGL